MNNDLMQLMISISSLLELKDPYTEGHCSRVRAMASIIANGLGIGNPDADDILLAATLHDIGKVGIPDAILNKPGKLTKEEYERIKEHPSLGALALRALPKFKNVMQIVKHHHERWDGAGYPSSLKEKEIPRGSRIISVVDTYDALTSHRAYRKAVDHEIAIEIIAERSGTQFDPQVVKKFIELNNDMRLDKDSRTGIDPVCGMEGDSFRYVALENGKVYFCSDACMEEYVKKPEKYLPEIIEAKKNSDEKNLKER